MAKSTLGEAQRKTAPDQKDEEYAVDVTIDSEYFLERYEHELLPAIKETFCTEGV